MQNLKILAKILANSVHMDVAFEPAKTASCDGKTVRIPSHWGLSTDPEDEIIVRGMMDHEALGHGRFTDFDVFTQKFKSHHLTKLDAAVHNILEDIFIETMAIKTKPGTRHNICELVRVLTQRENFFGPDPSQLLQTDQSGAELLVNALLIVCRSRLLPGQAQYLGSRAEAYEAICQQKFGELWTRIYAVAAKAASAQSTRETLDLTLQIKQLLQEAAVGQLPDSPQSQSPGDASNPEQGESGQHDQEQEDCKESQSVLSRRSGCTSGATHKKTRSAAQSILDTADETMPEVEITEAASQEMNDASRDAWRSPVYDPVCDKWAYLGPVDPGSIAIANQIASRSEEIIDVLKTLTHAGRRVCLAGKRLSSRHLSRIPTGDLRVFSQKSSALGIDTAVILMTDFSSSMASAISRQDSTRRSVAANGLYIGLADLLDEYEVPFSAYAFDSKPQSLKWVDEDWSSKRRQLLVPYPDGGTMAGAALYQAISEAASLTQQRRLIVLITDGVTRDPSTLDAAYQDASELGIDVVTVMLGEDCASYYHGKAERCLTTARLVDYTIKAVEAAISD